MTILTIEYSDNNKIKCLLLPHKKNKGWSFINLTKEHICPCIFNTREEALQDLKNYPKIIKYTIEEI